MTKHASFELTQAAMRGLDPASAALTDEERHRADAAFSRIVATPHQAPAAVSAPRPRRRLVRFLIPAGVLAAAVAVALPTALSSGSAFASWTASPAPLTRSAETAAATTCRSILDVHDQGARITVSERRGGWAFLLLDGPKGEGACLMPETLIGATEASPKSGFFGSYDTDPAKPPTPQRDGIVETESAGGAVSLPGRFSVGTRDGWFNWTSGYAGDDVTGVTVHPPVGPEVEASLVDGRFSAWWPAGEARGDNPGVGGAWTYTLTLASGGTRQVPAQ